MTEDMIKETRKVKPYPAIPEDIEPVPEEWQAAGTLMIFSILAVLSVICLALFFTGVWIWSRLV